MSKLSGCLLVLLMIANPAHSQVDVRFHSVPGPDDGANQAGSLDQSSYSSAWDPSTFGDNHFQSGYYGDGCAVPTVTSFFGVDGSKQPQDFGANANLGVRTRLNFAAPLMPENGIGFQIGSAVSFSGNAVQVFELLGESKDRFQSFTTLALFQRFDNGFSWSAGYDLLYQESFDQFQLGQWRIRAGLETRSGTEIGITINIADRSDTGQFNTIDVLLEPVEQMHIYLRTSWQSGVVTTFWVGVADEHSEENVVTGTLPEKNNQILFGADFLAPLNDRLAIYGETNLVMPADTGAVDAFLGIEYSPQGIGLTRGRGNRFRSHLPVASNPSFTTNLIRR